MPFRLGHHLVVASALLWATAGIATYAAPAGTSASVFGAARLLLGAAAIALIIGPRQFFQAVPLLPRGALVTASIAMALFQWSFFAAIPGAGASITALVSAASAPFCADAIVAASERQLLCAQWRFALLCSCAGVLLFGLSSHVTVLGLSLALASGATYAAYTLAAAKLEQTHSAAGMAGTVVSLLGAGLTLMPVAAPHLSALLTPRGLAVATYLGLATTALAYCLFVLGLRHLTPGTALTLLYVQPIAALLFGALLLGEQLEWPELLGVAHIAAAALLHLRAGNSRFSPTNKSINRNNTPQGKCYVEH